MKMIRLKRMSDCTWNEAMQAWNEGFQGYFADMTMTIERFTDRFGMEGLSPALSVIAFDGDIPVGMIVNGIKEIKGEKVGWNGGTAVAPAYRKQGVGKVMMDFVLDVYAENGVTVATLEAIRENEKAIALYEQKGYRIFDRLVHLKQNGKLQLPEAQNFTIQPMRPPQVVPLSFYVQHAPWQTQALNVRDAEAAIAYEGNEAVGYALYKHMYNEQGELTHILLYQCVGMGAQEREIVASLLYHVLRSNVECARMAINLPEESTAAALLQEAGFMVYVSQVQMRKEM
jgi:GNAT superfamily N-acetyltransferase